MIEEKIISKSETAGILGISSASVRNWVKHGFLKPVSQSDLNNFFIDDVLSLKNRIESGELDRLKKRANKSYTSRTFVPDELLIGTGDLNTIIRIAEFISENGIDENTALFLLAVNLLKKKGVIQAKESVPFLISDNIKISGRESLSKELSEWHNSARLDEYRDDIQGIMNFDLTNQDDILGLIYQSILKEGKKVKRGSYYTPKIIVDGISRDYSFENCLFLDPCCGTGQFLLSFAKYIKHPENIYGFDIDPIAVRIARINLLIEYSSEDFKPNIFCQNSLTDFSGLSLFEDNHLPEFDVVATNPPWGMHFSKEHINQLKDIYPEIRSEESFSYFLKTGIDLLKKNGNLIYILPEAVLNVQTHEDIRNYILLNTSIDKIQYLDRVFKNVFSPVVVLELCRTGSKQYAVIIKKNNEYKINQERFASNPNMVFDIHINSRDMSLISKVYSLKHITLKENAEWALGIVTGNNKKYLFREKADEGYEPIYRGRDIEAFTFLKSGHFIKFEPQKFQQAAPEYRYRAEEKLVYRFISKSLVFAYDNKQRLTLNSANILIPCMEYPIKVILALFNSSLYQFIFQKKFSSIKVLRSHLEQLPLPVLNSDYEKTIIEYADGIINGNDISEELDNYIFDIFDITEAERAYILECIV